MPFRDIITKLPTMPFGNFPRKLHILKTCSNQKAIYIARPIKLEIIIIANQRREIELHFVRIVKLFYAEGIFIQSNEDKES